MGSTIFVIDSSPAVHRMVEQLSMPDGHTVRGFHDGPSALEAARAQSPALIIADYHLEKITFSGFCKEIGRQDNLAETLIISMVDAADRLDESKLRSLGVRAFLKKPFQREQLLETINTILTGTTGRPTAKPAKARTWPPVSTGTDDEDEQELPLDTAADEPPRHEREKEQATMSPLPTQPVLASTSSSSRSKGEELMKDLVDHLLHSTTVQADKTITTLLPGAIAKEVAGQLGTALSKAVQAEVHKQVADAIAPERLQLSLRAMIQEELKRHTEAQLASVEATTRQAVTDIAPALVEQAADIRLGELTDSGIQKHLPHALQAHLDMITQLVKKEVEHVAANCARQ
ncbi:MAG TPA: response regulator, partial [Nitrospira sp.]|nr:response regulator [Nitrospira sp.]